jgi:ElaB/YqjD/DUF883 family membrane-anchored ribosome-binding protein
MDPQPDVIREQIEETRSSLTEKLETLEAEVKGTVQNARETVESAKEAVEDTISSVKQSVQNATDTVKRTFDVPYQVNRHPFAMLGLSFLGGLALGALSGGRFSSGRRLADRMSEASVVPPQRRPEEPQRSAWNRLTDRLTHGEPGKPGFVDKLSSQLGDEMEKVKDMAIAALVGVVADVAKKSIPVLADKVEHLMTETASRVGAPLAAHEPRGDGGYGAPEYRPPGYQPPPGYGSSSGLE